MRKVIVAIAAGVLLTLGIVGPALADNDTPGSVGLAQGCAIALLQTANTPGWPFVKAACDRALGAVGSAPVAVPVAPIDGVLLGCGMAIAQTWDTPGAAFVKAGCQQAINSVGGMPPIILSGTSG